MKAGYWLPAAPFPCRLDKALAGPQSRYYRESRLLGLLRRVPECPLSMRLYSARAFAGVICRRRRYFSILRLWSLFHARRWFRHASQRILSYARCLTAALEADYRAADEARRTIYASCGDGHANAMPPCHFQHYYRAPGAESATLSRTAGALTT